MLICVEGCIGVGKSTLVRVLSRYLNLYFIHEEYKSNPFLKDFYQDPNSYALHVQITFMLMQERNIRQAITRANMGQLVVSDFHPVKSKIFSDVVLQQEDKTLALNIYEHLFGNFPKPDLMIYLRAEKDIILSRIKERNDPHKEDISAEYIEIVSKYYDDFFSNYIGDLLIIDNSDFDYVNSREQLARLMGLIKSTLDISQYIGPSNQP